MMKKIFALTLAILMIATCLVACGGNEETNGTKIAVQKGTTSLMYAQLLKGTEAVSYPSFWCRAISTTILCKILG